MHISVIIILLVLTAGCRKSDLTDEINMADYPDWTEETHGSLVNPDYDMVFDHNSVLRFDIEIDEDDWEDMMDDLADILSSGGHPGSTNLVSSTPVFVPCSFRFNGIEWYNVGIRFKGNSSLRSTYQSGNDKLPFKVDFDEFGNEFPAMENQRFYGFRQLSLKNNFDDKSLMREKVTADLFRDFGLVSAKTAFCVLYVDHGSGPQYYGVYSLVEEPDDTLLESQFFNNTGNLYKPDGDAASFAQGSFDESEMEKRNNYTEDYSDVESLYSIINSSERTSNTEQWKTDLSEIFNVDVFLKWLAANTVMQNWDTYGIMTHNYYLYNNPDNGTLTWIPWDNNEALQEGKQGGALSLSLSEVASNWPLIRYIINMEEYEQKYKEYVSEFTEEVFIPTNVQAIYDTYYQLLRNYAYDEENGCTFIFNDSDFDQAVDELKDHVQARNNAVSSYLN